MKWLLVPGVHDEAALGVPAGVLERSVQVLREEEVPDVRVLRMGWVQTDQEQEELY